jgi:hypothetical protein
MRRHDEAFKILINQHPPDLVTIFAPDLEAQWGKPSAVIVESVEVLPHVKGLRRSRFLDFAVTITWTVDDTQHHAVLILTEHFSRADKVDLNRIALYTAAMMHRHPGVPVLPIVLIGSTKTPVPNRLINRVGDLMVMDFQCRTFLVETECLPAWDRTRSPVLAVLSALMRDMPKDAVAFRALTLLRQFPKVAKFLEANLALIQDFARMNDFEVEAFYQRIKEETNMLSIIDLIKADGIAEGEARGKAEGKAEGRAEGEARGKGEGTIATLRSLVHSGVITVDAARAQVHRLQQEGEITAEIAAKAISQLG